MDTHQYESGDDAERMWHAPTKTEETVYQQNLEFIKKYGTICMHPDDEFLGPVFKPHPNKVFTVVHLNLINQTLLMAMMRWAISLPKPPATDPYNP